MRNLKPCMQPDWTVFYHLFSAVWAQLFGGLREAKAVTGPSPVMHLPATPRLIAALTRVMQPATGVEGPGFGRSHARPSARKFTSV